MNPKFFQLSKFSITAALCALMVAAAAALLWGCNGNSEARITPMGNHSGTATDAGAGIQADELRIGSLKGPTSVGLASMMQQGQGVFTVVATADELATKFMQNEIDIALLPANLAATLYARSNGTLRVLDVNTLGVLYGVSASPIPSVGDLSGHTIYMTGKGTVPEYTFRAVLEANNLDPNSLDIQYKSEPAEVAALIAADPKAVGILPQPYATAVTMKNNNLKINLDLTKAWEEATGGERGSIITGVTITKAIKTEEKRAAIQEFIDRHRKSTAVAQEDPASIAQTVVDMGIIENAALAEKAIPLCNVVCITGLDMENALKGYYRVLLDQNPESVGGSTPNNTFYFIN